METLVTIKEHSANLDKTATLQCRYMEATIYSTRKGFVVTVPGLMAMPGFFATMEAAKHAVDHRFDAEVSQC